jgi:hypothetical protein
VTVRPADEDVEAVREAHAKAMEALGADVHPYSASAIRDWEAEMDARLTALSARVSAAETGQAAAEQRAADAEKALREAHVIYEAECKDWIDTADPSDPDEVPPPWQRRWGKYAAALAAARAGEATEEKEPAA